jgi:phospholipid transport system substrate-binding protein
MMVATYASRFDDFGGEKFEVAPAVDQGADKLVKTRLVQSNGKAVDLNYLMKAGGDGYRINDIFLNGTISELAGRRAEFTSILKSGGADALIASIKAKGDKLMSGT